MRNKKIIIGIILILLVIATIFFIKNMTKNRKNVNNMSSQKIVDKIINTNSYKAKVLVEVKSNKNHNKYILQQEYNTENGCIQEVIEPSNIAGIKIIKKDNHLKIENTELDLNTIFENYKGIEDNSLDLNVFIKEFSENKNSKVEEKNGNIIISTVSENNNKYQKNKKLYIDKKSQKPTKLLIQDNNQNTTIIIEYNEIELN